MAASCGRDQWTVYPHGQPATLNAHTIGIELANGGLAILYEATQVSTPLDASVLRGVEAMQQTPLIVGLHRISDGSVVMRNPSGVQRFGIIDMSVRRNDFAAMFVDPAQAESAFGQVRHKQIHSAEADYAALGTAAGFCHHCHTGKCPVGVTTQDAVLEQRLEPDVGAKHVKNYLKTLTMELTTLARACGKQDVHHLEPEDLVALTVEAAAMARVPLAGTQWIPGQNGF